MHMQTDLMAWALRRQLLVHTERSVLAKLEQLVKGWPSLRVRSCPTRMSVTCIACEYVRVCACMHMKT
jgi:hypothetical protein